VTDSSGAVIPGASVTVTNTATRQKRLGKSNASGLYNILFLQPGLYDVLVENAGFTSQERKGIDVQVGNSARVDISMPVGGASQSVTVSAGAALIDAESTSLGSVFESDKITQLPLNGRDYTQLVGLAPNVVMEAPITGTNGGSTTLQGGVRSLTSISVAGQRLELNHYTLDGVENTDPNFNSYIVHPTIDAIQEFSSDRCLSCRVWRGRVSDQRHYSSWRNEVSSRRLRISPQSLC
jgi:hypothetical protein